MNGVVVWFTGLPGSGKTTLARRTRDALLRADVPCCLLDGDEVRDSFVPRPGYSPEERDRFYETLAHLAAMLARQGLVVLVPATAPRRAHRDTARACADRFVEVFVRVPLEECMRRDGKGLYAAARDGTIQNLPGFDVEYEEPHRPDVVAGGGNDEFAVAEAVAYARKD